MQHGGNIYPFARQLGCNAEDIIDFSANINPQQAVNAQDERSARFLETSAVLASLTAYSDPHYTLLKQALCRRYPVPDTADIEVFNGASAAIFALLRYLQPKDVVLYAPLYGEYGRLAERLGCNIHVINRLVGWLSDSIPQQIPDGATVIFVNPATPDGTLYDLNELLTQWQARNCHIIVDESFLDFCLIDSAMAALAHHEKLYIIKSLSKFYGCAGVRIGFVAAEKEFISALKQLEAAWKLSTFDMAYMQAALANHDFIQQTREATATNRALLNAVLKQSGKFAAIYPSCANFLLTRLPDGETGEQLQIALAPARILIRVCANFLGLDPRYVRFAVKEAPAIEKLADALHNTV